MQTEAICSLFNLCQGAQTHISIEERGELLNCLVETTDAGIEEVLNADK